VRLRLERKMQIGKENGGGTWLSSYPKHNNTHTEYKYNKLTTISGKQTNKHKTDTI